MCERLLPVRSCRGIDLPIMGLGKATFTVCVRRDVMVSPSVEFSSPPGLSEYRLDGVFARDRRPVRPSMPILGVAFIWPTVLAMEFRSTFLSEPLSLSGSLRGVSLLAIWGRNDGDMETARRWWVPLSSDEGWPAAAGVVRPARSDGDMETARSRRGWWMPPSSDEVRAAEVRGRWPVPAAVVMRRVFCCCLRRVERAFMAWICRRICHAQHAPGPNA
jgi:hypothetical protein